MSGGLYINWTRFEIVHGRGAKLDEREKTTLLLKEQYETRDGRGREHVIVGGFKRININQ